ncbi:hypothetical protein JCM15765_16340 [Paradesulfitobacterium aromaticivorans]
MRDENKTTMARIRVSKPKQAKVHAVSPKIGRNYPCPCGSGKKPKNAAGEAMGEKCLFSLSH